MEVGAGRSPARESFRHQRIRRLSICRLRTWPQPPAFVRVRLGLSGSATTPALVRLLLFPFSLAYLLLFAAIVHTRRRIRIS